MKEFKRTVAAHLVAECIQSKKRKAPSIEDSNENKINNDDMEGLGDHTRFWKMSTERVRNVTSATL
jgi:hypothetical protein